jgi:ABC-type Fe3+ transport system permease subunit
LVLPAILGGLIISFLEAIAVFGAPALIALPGRFQVVATQLWQFFEFPTRVEDLVSSEMEDAALAKEASCLRRVSELGQAPAADLAHRNGGI